ncbi:putative PIN and TRAM-domain containing protein YacL [Weizmannia acidilactici]|uniref:PIN and TRAM-domain containing protein YacL n=1 Tax=Weizmannia acidilactici TaxID=2607726 RepID=A0A5J4JHH9_9BACI|nr:PIN/TRAM domain-containing protein [Weizmannia acidilactici]GER67285.1 putative PIN and TRAM-domain containing protein YacL [Weizmannia acidilactici]GER69927.1 putative PIN and TRAM-domain containing protein YacL [Weizmannia acidilactici]GER73294.1 putative PIN and TRAM-domain containing protein YacL [Weizmannia acidilactici]
MLRRLVQICFVLVGGTLGVFLLPDLYRLIDFHYVLIANPYVSAVLGAIIFYLISFWSINYIVDFVNWFEDSLVKVPITEILSGSLGLIFGLFIAYLAGIPFNKVGIPIVNTIVPIILTVLLGYVGFQVGFKKREEFVNLFFNRQHKRKGGTEQEGQPQQVKKMKILDTSVIIDGRIADICQTGFLDGPIVIPLFVLEELQHIADSSDALKRNRGRRGLDILNRIQNELSIEVQMYEGDFEDIQEVDSKLIKLAKMTNGIVVTNDYNLNKVCEFQKVQVLNINDLANAVKPVVLPGEELNVQLIKDGKEHHQGIAYLDDGTMIVVEEGKNYIGKRIDVLVTSVLQTSAGRMIFAKPKLLEKAL